MNYAILLAIAQTAQVPTSSVKVSLFVLRRLSQLRHLQALGTVEADYTITVATSSVEAANALGSRITATLTAASTTTLTNAINANLGAAASTWQTTVTANQVNIPCTSSSGCDNGPIGLRPTFGTSQSNGSLDPTSLILIVVLVPLGVLSVGGSVLLIWWMRRRKGSRGPSSSKKSRATNQSAGKESPQAAADPEVRQLEGLAVSVEGAVAPSVWDRMKDEVSGRPNQSNKTEGGLEEDIVPDERAAREVLPTNIVGVSVQEEIKSMALNMKDNKEKAAFGATPVNNHEGKDILDATGDDSGRCGESSQWCLSCG